MHCLYSESAHFYSADGTAQLAPSVCFVSFSIQKHDAQTPVRGCVRVSVPSKTVRCHSVLGDGVVRPNATTRGGSRQSCCSHAVVNTLASSSWCHKVVKCRSLPD